MDRIRGWTELGRSTLGTSVGPTESRTLYNSPSGDLIAGMFSGVARFVKNLFQGEEEPTDVGDGTGGAPPAPSGGAPACDRMGHATAPWACDRCTLINQADDLSCAACEGPKPPVMAEGREVRGVGAAAYEGPILEELARPRGGDPPPRGASKAVDDDGDAAHEFLQMEPKPPRSGPCVVCRNDAHDYAGEECGCRVCRRCLSRRAEDYLREASASSECPAPTCPSAGCLRRLSEVRVAYPCEVARPWGECPDPDIPPITKEDIIRDWEVRTVCTKERWGHEVRGSTSVYVVRQTRTRAYAL